MVKREARRAGFGQDIELSDLDDDNELISSDRVGNDIGNRPGRYRCTSCKKIIRNITSYEASYVYFNWFYNEKTNYVDDTHQLADGVDDGAEIMYLCGECDTELTYSFDVAEAILSGADINLSGIKVIEEVKEGEEE